MGLHRQKYLDFETKMTKNEQKYHFLSKKCSKLVKNRQKRAIFCNFLTYNTHEMTFILLKNEQKWKKNTDFDQNLTKNDENRAK